MTYLPENIFKNILAYCDDRIEREQKQRISNLNKTIVNMNNLQNIIIETSNSSLSLWEKERIIQHSFNELCAVFLDDSMNWSDNSFYGEPSHFLILETPPFYNDDSMNYEWRDDR
jgi:hypothetical protein